MKSLIIVFAALHVSALIAQNDSMNFQILYKNDLVYVSAEKILYETQKSKHFFIHYRIHNLSKNNIGVFTDAYFGLFYPNQWGIESQPVRTIINERRIIPTALNDSLIDLLETKFKNAELALIPPDGNFDYYRDFNNGKKKDITLDAGKFMFVSTDGQLLMTDGSRVIHAHFDNPSSLEGSNIFLSYPLIWKTIPIDSKIYHEN